MTALRDGRPVAEARHEEVAGGRSNFKGKDVLGVKAGASKMATEGRKTDEQKRFEAAQIEPPTKPDKCRVSGDGLKTGFTAAHAHEDTVALGQAQLGHELAAHSRTWRLCIDGLLQRRRATHHGVG